MDVQLASQRDESDVADRCPTGPRRQVLTSGADPRRARGEVYQLGHWASMSLTSLLIGVFSANQEVIDFHSWPAPTAGCVKVEAPELQGAPASAQHPDDNLSVRVGVARQS